MILRVLALTIASLPSLAAAQAASEHEPRYLASMRSELDAMGIEAQCETASATRARCVYRGRASLTDRGFEVHADYSDETDTIYFYVTGLLTAPVGGPATPALLARLMELNWELLACKLEWNPRTGEVRLSAVMHTDSNFDRRTFRSIVVALDTTTARYQRELRQLAAQLSERPVDHASAAEVRKEASGEAP